MKAIFAKWHAAAMKGEPFWSLHSRETIIALELEGSFEQFAGGVEEHAVRFGRDVIAGIPPGSILLCSHGTRGVITALCESRVNAETVFALTCDAMAEKGCLDFWRSVYGGWIYIPTDEEGAKCYNEYREDARRRLKENKLRPGESVTEAEVEGKVQFGNWLSVMAINSLVARLIFDKNPDREFYVEQGFPIEWMQPHLSPHGLIMKLKRQPLAEFSDELIQKDCDSWARYIEPMIGDWLKRDTAVREIAGFVEKVHINGDFSGFEGDPRFVQNRVTQRLFSDLRRAIADLCAWRGRNAKNPVERDRMVHEADFAYRQAFALGPAAPIGAWHYAGVLIGEKRFDDAILVVETTKRLDPEDVQLSGLLEQLKRMKEKAEGC